jgi:tetratricopeptide (TPR) repeat protein
MKRILFLASILIINATSVLGKTETSTIDSLWKLSNSQIAIEKVKTIIEISEIIYSYDIDSSITLNKQCVKELGKLPETEKSLLLNVKAASNIGALYIYKEQLDSARIYLQRALTKAKALEIPSELITAHNNIGLYYSNIGELDSSMSHFEQGIRIATESNLKKRLGAIYLNQSILYTKKNDLNRSIEIQLANLIIQEKLKDSLNISATLRHLGNLYNKMDDYESSIKYLKEAIEIQKHKGYVYELTKSLSNLASTLLFNGDTIEALSKYHECRLIQLEHNIDTSRILICLGRMYTSQRDFASAENFLSKAKKALIQTQNQDLRTLLLIELCRLEYTKLSYDSALDYGTKAYENAAQIENLQYQADAAVMLYQIYYAKEDYKNAIKYHDTYKDLRNILETDQKKVKAERQRLSFIYNKEKHLIELNQEKERLKAQHEKNILNLIIWLTVIALSLIIILLIYFFKRRQHQQKLKSAKRELELKLQSIEREQNLLMESQKLEQEVLHKTKIIQQKNEIIERISDSNEEFRSNLTDRLNLEHDWLQFMAEFSLLHPNFFRNLESNFSGITNTDKKISALIKLGLSNKEIANLMNITENGAKKAKQRLKSKLTSEKTSTLSSLISDI